MASLRQGVKRFFGRHVGGTAVVLIYHRVAKLERDPQLLAVTPERFDEHIELLAREYAPVPLASLAESLRRGQVPHRGVAVTFDDGYADSLTHAEPALRRHGVPATVFVSSGYLGGTREFWWDELERVLLAPTVLPERLVIDAADFGFEAELGDRAAYGHDAAAANRDWTVLDQPRDARQRAYLVLARGMRPLAAGVRRDVLAQLRAAAGLDEAARPSHRQLTADEVLRLDASPLVEIGGHTVNHALLSARSEQEQRREIAEDAVALSGICGRPITAFSYPYGGLDDYTDTSVDLAREAGYAYACSNHPAAVKPWTDLFRIPRHIVRDFSAEEFALRLESWFRGDT